MKINGSKVFLIFTIFYLYFIMALFESSRGNFIPFFIDEFKINNTTISIILSLYTGGCVIGSYLGGRLCEKFSHKFVFIFGSVVSTAAVFTAPFTSNIFQLGLFNLLFGIGRSSLCVAIDSMVPVLSMGFEVILMNITHFMYGFGSFAGQSFYGELLSGGVPWRTIYLYLGIFFIASLIFTAFMRTPNMRVTHSSIAVSRKELYKNKIIYLFVLAVTFELITEAVINTWFISYARSTYGFGPADAAYYASAFFFLFAVGRLSGGFIINRLGDVNGLKIFMLIGSVCIFLGLILKESGLLLIASSGFFISIGFPTLMVLINKSFKDNSSFAIGLITTFSNILYVVMFNLTGVLNDIFNTYIAFFTAPLSMMGSFFILIFIAKRIRNNGLSN